MGKGTIAIVGLLVLAGGAGCKRKSHGYQYDPPPPPEAAKASDATGLSWQDSKLVVAGLPNAAGYILDDDKSVFRLKASFYGFPEGTKIGFGSETYPVASGGSLERRIDVSQELSSAEYEGLFDAPWDRKITVTIAFPGGMNFSIQVPPQNQYTTKRMLASGFASVREAPVSFANEPAAPSKPRNVFYVPAPIGIADPEVVGTIKKVNEVDRVAVEKHVPTETTVACHGYKKTDKNDGPSESLTVRLVNSEVQLFDRRTGKLLETKTFNAGKDCPMFSFGRKGEEAQNHASRDAVKEWLRASLRSGK